MKTVLVPLLIASSSWAATIVSGSSTYHKGVFPFTSDTSFNLVLSSGPITAVNIFHEYQQGAKGGFDADYTTNFNITPVPAFIIPTIGISTPFSATVNGITYYQGGSAGATSLPAPDDFNLFGSLTLTQILGTNIVDTTQDSSANGLFSLTGSVTVLVNGSSYTETFSGLAAFNGFYSTQVSQSQPIPVLSETYTFSPVPEPSTGLEVITALGILALVKQFRRAQS